MMDTAEIYAQKIREEIEAGNLHEALSLIHEVQEFLNHPALLKVQALLCVAAKEYGAAKKILMHARLQIPDDGEIYYLLTQCYENEILSPDVYGTVRVIDTSNDQIVSYGSTLDLYANRCVSARQGVAPGAPRVSIYFLAYNNLEKYTKYSIEALLRYTKDIDYELILVDNGSSDGTLSYFEQIPFEKKRIYRLTQNRGAGYGYVASERFCLGKIFRGEYVVMLPQDVIVTQNWLSNLLYCMDSDSRIGMAVPFSDNVSNCQAVDLGYMDMEDMQRKAAAFNQSDPNKWEERLRVIPTTYIIRTELWELYQADPAFVYNFMDDDQCFTYRHLGYRLMACGDTFVHHGGHVGFQDLEQFETDLQNGYNIFISKHGIDPWEDILNCEFEMCDHLLHGISIRQQITVLGIDVRCGAPLLTIKNNLKKYKVKPLLSAYTTNAKYYSDLRTVVGEAVCYGDTEQILEKCHHGAYDLILLGEYIDQYADFGCFLIGLLELLRPEGRLAVKIRCFPEIDDLNSILSHMENMPHPQEGSHTSLQAFLLERGLRFELSEILRSDTRDSLWRKIRVQLEQESKNQYEDPRLSLYTDDKFLQLMKEYTFVIYRNV